MAVYQNENEPDGQLPLDAGSEMKYLRQRWKKRRKQRGLTRKLCRHLLGASEAAVKSHCAWQLPEQDDN